MIRSPLAQREATYAMLEEQMLKRGDLAGVPVVVSGEPFVVLESNAEIATSQIDQETRGLMGGVIAVRARVAAALGVAASALQRGDGSLRIEIVHGYRSLATQTRLFSEQIAALNETYSGDELVEAAHRRVASPDVAGHPTGGAVDVRILEGVRPLDMGTPIWSFEPDSYVASPYVSREAQQNRARLRGVMLDAGFAPFDGEWWHFSLGDREWARYQGAESAAYEQVDVAIVLDWVRRVRGYR